jgi:hypothetical protein
MRLAVVAAVVVAAGCGSSPQHASLPREPSLGLRCRPDTYPCQRIGLAVWLAHPAQLVDATVDGHSVRLRTRPGAGSYAKGRFWQGVFRDVRAEEFAEHFPKRLHVEIREIRVRVRNGSELVANADPIVSAGSG